MRTAIPDHGHNFTGEAYPLSSVGGDIVPGKEIMALKCKCGDGLFVTIKDGELTASFVPKEGGTLDGSPIWTVCTA